MMRARRVYASFLIVALMLMIPSACAARGSGSKDKMAGMTAQEVYDLGMVAQKKGSWFRSRNIMQRALGKPDATPDLIAKIHLALADAYFFDGGLVNLAEALSRYTNFLTFYPNHPRTDYAQYQLGLCHLRQALNPDRDQAETHKAVFELDMVKRRYPDSEWIDEAEEKADEARERIAEHDYRIGYFYFRQHSWTGAAERFRRLLEDFPKYSRKDRVYLHLGESLINTSRGDEAQLYLNRLISEFPESSAAGDARRLIERTAPPTASK
jgi:outer membrane protein assembly factor BamD